MTTKRLGPFKKIFILSAAAAASSASQSARPTSVCRLILRHPFFLVALLDAIFVPVDALTVSSSSSASSRSPSCFPRKERQQIQHKHHPAETDSESESNKILTVMQKTKPKSSLISLLQEQNNTMSQVECDALLADFVISNDENDWKQALGWIQKQQTTVPKSTYDACLQACLEHAQFAERAVEILALMNQTGTVKPDVHHYSLCILALCRKHVQEHQQQKQKQQQSFNSSSSLSSSLWRQALELQQQLAQTNQQLQKQKQQQKVEDLPIAVYDAILTCMVHDMAWKDALRLLHQLQQQKQQQQQQQSPYKAQPAASTYRITIECCVAANQPEQALQVLQSCMTANNHMPTTYAFELVVLSLCRNRQWRRARSLLDDMERLDVPRNLAIYNALLQACQRAGEVAAAQQLLTRLERREPHSLQPNVRSYNAVMAVCTATSHWKEAIVILDRIHRAPGVEPDLYSYTNAIRACARVGKNARALSLFQVVKDKKLTLDSYLYTAVMEACSWQQSLELLDEMKNKGIEPSEVTYSVAIKACGAAGQWQKALELLETMRSQNMPINLFVYNAAITAVSKAAKQRRGYGHDGRAKEGEDLLWTRVMSLLVSMRKDGIEPDGFSFASAISCCGAEGRWEEALQLMDVMEKRGTRPNKVAYTAAIASCGRAGQVENAMRLFRQMKEQGLAADRVAYNALFTALRVAKRSEAAFELWHEMLGTSQNQKPNHDKAALDSSQRRTNQIASSRQSDAYLDPDIITVTDAIGAMSLGENEPADCEKVDEVFAEAVRRGIVLRNDSMDTCSEFDLSGMSLPVARAAVRFLVKRLAASMESKNLVFITGVGRSGKSVGGGSTALREYVQEILLQDFVPGLTSTVPKLAQGTVEVSPIALANWRRRQR